MQPAIDTIKDTSRNIGRSATFKLFTISVLILILLIPAGMVKSLIQERDYRHQSVIDEISEKWGGPQIITGPVLTVPYLKHVKDKEGKTTTWIRHLHLLPDAVNIHSQITPHVRYRGIYKAILYNTTLSIEGKFPRIPLDDLSIAPENIQWKSAVISLGITDMRGITDRIKASFAGAPLSMEPGLETAEVIQSGVNANIVMDSRASAYPFQFSLNLNGSRELQFTPVGKETIVTVQSEWQDPSFGGAFLPAERSISEKGFSAKWKILHLNRNYPQHWNGEAHDLSGSTFGVSLFNPVDVYQKSTRTAKYALMFIVFTFLAFFISEIMNRLRVHPVQYLLIGLGIIVFYTLLLSISEHAGFGLAYLVSASCVIGMITGYTKAILKHRTVTAMVGGILTVLYAYLYIVLQLEDYALLMGSIGLFLVLAAVMFFTRKIDWYAAPQENFKPRSAKPTHATGNSTL